MSGWRDRILGELAPGIARLTVVADPDGLLLEEGVLAGVRERGFELLPFEDRVAFRYAYESRFRARWDRGEETELVVVLRSEASDLSSLPYDLLQTGRQLSFSLGELFPRLSYPVVAALDRGYLDALYEAQARHASGAGTLGNNATKDFVLRHVFDVVPEDVREPSDLLRVLLRRHHREQHIPALLDERLLQVLHQQGDFDGWPLETIVPDREAFFAFVQERWPLFLNRAANRGAGGTSDRGDLEYPGPADLPFDHNDVRVYIDSLFLEGLLAPVPHEQADALPEAWFTLGIQTDEGADRSRRVDGLLRTLANEIPEENAPHEAWFRFARTWAELMALALETHAEELPIPTWEEINALRTRMDDALEPWLTKRYASLVNLPPAPPVMLHHIPRFLARHIEDAREHKVAFVLMDGLALDQWVAIRKEIARQRADYRFREGAVFAWIPTITSVSRQAAFAGKPPIYFPDSIHTTNREPALWKQFWSDEGRLKPEEVGYAKGLGGGALDEVDDIVTHPGMRAVGLVVNMVDDIMHGMKLGDAGMHNQVRQWAAGPFLTELFDLLLNNGFRVWLSSDHGNIEATGCGRPSEGAVAEVRGERARVYSDELLRARIKAGFPEALEWPHIGLPEDYLPLLAPGRAAFIREGEKVVGHGGVCLEELIVPFVEIERKDP